MATMALPIQQLGADVTIDVAAAQKRCLDVIDAVQSSDAFLAAWLWYKSRRLDSSFGHLIVKQEKLIDKLLHADTSQYTSEAFDGLADDLDRLVSLTFAVIDDASAVRHYADLWRPKLEKMGSRASHISSIAESLRVEANPQCLALMSLAAEQVI